MQNNLTLRILDVHTHPSLLTVNRQLQNRRNRMVGKEPCRLGKTCKNQAGGKGACQFDHNCRFGSKCKFGPAKCKFWHTQRQGKSTRKGKGGKRKNNNQTKDKGGIGKGGQQLNGSAGEVRALFARPLSMLPRSYHSIDRCSSGRHSQRVKSRCASSNAVLNTITVSAHPFSLTARVQFEPA